MQTDFQELFYAAEDHYLQPAEIATFKHQVDSLKERLATYKWLRNQEISLFQPIADGLLRDFPQQNPKLIERALKHWIAVMRYGSMAMLLNNPDYFQHRLLEWLTDVVHAHEMVAVEQRLYERLQDSLYEMLPQEQWQLLKPFLSQAHHTLLESKTNVKPILVGEEA
jgi:hypothetical protein